MPRLSLYRPEKGKDYKFIDKTIWEMFQIGGTDVLIHRYLGPGDPAAGTASPSTPQYDGTNPFQIQDLLFLENRDRKYDPNVYLLRGVYNIQDIDFNLSQFGLFLQNDTIFITFHINDTVEKLSRKLIAGDVIELPHLKDEYALNDLQFALKRFYVIEEVNRAAEGFSVTWYPHLYRAKCKPLVDSQEFKQILDGLADQQNYQGVWDPAIDYSQGDIVSYPNANGTKYTAITDNVNTPPRNPDGTLNDAWKVADSLRDIMSTYETEMQITQAILDQAEADAPKSGYDTSKYYTLQVDQNGTPELVTINQNDILSNYQVQATDENGNLLFDNNNQPIYLEPTAGTINQTAENSGYPGYLVGDGLPPNGAPFTSGISFPTGPIKGQFCLRTDYMPKRLFRFDGSRWVKVEDDVRMTMSNTDTRNTYKTGFINNQDKTYIDKTLSDTFYILAPLSSAPTETVNEYRSPVISVKFTTFNVNEEKGTGVLVKTSVDFVNDYSIKAFLNEVNVKTTVSKTDTNTVQFTIDNVSVSVGDRVDWSVYRQQINQRQSLSKALKPEADL